MQRLTTAAIYILLALLLTGASCEVLGGHLVTDVICDPPVSVEVTYKPARTGAPPVVDIYRFDFDLEEWLDQNLDGAPKSIVAMLAEAAARECEGLSLPSAAYERRSGGG